MGKYREMRQGLSTCLEANRLWLCKEVIAEPEDDSFSREE